jgi:hypothetical protein
MKRTLSLKREALAELAGADLVRVAGGTTTDRPTMQVSCMEVESCFATGCCVFSQAICLGVE